MGDSPRLRRLRLSPAAWFVLPSGALVPAATLLEPGGARLLRDCWLRAEAERVEAAGGSWLEIRWRPPC